LSLLKIDHRVARSGRFRAPVDDGALCRSRSGRGSFGGGPSVYAGGDQGVY
jgi:hypothetical protein